MEILSGAAICAPSQDDGIDDVAVPAIGMRENRRRQYDSDATQ